MTAEKLNEIYGLLYKRFGPQHWWPGQSTLEIMAGAILTQNTNWDNVEKAIANLKAAGRLSVEGLGNTDISELARLIRPAGYYNVKAKRLKNFVNWLIENFNGELPRLQSLSTELLREKLLTVRGVGRETADSILLYALDRSIFVVDAYTSRIAARHRLIEPASDYESLRELFESNLPPDSRLFNEYHALLVRLGKEFCRRRARCTGCPLEKLPHDSDVEAL